MRQVVSGLFIEDGSENWVESLGLHAHPVDDVGYLIELNHDDLIGVRFSCAFSGFFELLLPGSPYPCERRQGF